MVLLNVNHLETIGRQMKMELLHLSAKMIRSLVEVKIKDGQIYTK